MGVLPRKTYKQIEWYLYNYYSIKREIEERKEDIIESGNREIMEYGGGISYHSDPTASKALKLCKKDIVNYEKWLKVIESVIRKCDGTPLGLLYKRDILMSWVKLIYAESCI